MKKANAVIIAILVFVIAGGGGFFGGMQFQKSKQPSIPSFSRNGNFPGAGPTNVNGRFRGGPNGGGVRGEVTAAQNGTLTVKLQDGSSKLVLVGDTTMVSKTTTGLASDIVVGQSVMAVGTTNSDGSVTATSVQLNPETRDIPIPPTEQ